MQFSSGASYLFRTNRAINYIKFMTTLIIMKEKGVPQIIQDVGFNFWWDVRKVWKLDYPVEDMDISELEWHFEIPFWNTEKGYYDLRPIDVMDSPSTHEEEFNRTMRTDLAYPVDIMMNKGRWLILDGLHRLVKARIQDIRKIKVRRIPRSEIKNIEK